MKQQPYQLKTLGRGLDVLAALKAAPGPMVLSELARQSGESIAVIFRILKTLEAHEYIQQDAKGKSYRLAHRSLAIGSTTSIIARVLRYLSQLYPGAVTGSVLAARLGVGESELNEQLLALQSECLIEDLGAGDWRLAYGCLKLAAPLIGQDDLLTRVKPVMESLREETRETISLFLIAGDQQIVVACLPSQQPIRYVLHVGDTFPLYLGAAGKSVLASMTHAEVEQYLDRVDLMPTTEFTPSKDKLLEDLQQNRKRGYSSSVAERVEGAAAVAVPIFERDKGLVAVLSILLPAYRTSQARLDAMGPLLVRATRAAGLATKPDYLPTSIS